MSIYRSISKKDVEGLQTALAETEDVNETKYGGETHLHWAAETGWGEGASILLKAGANPNLVSDGGNTPLMKAIISRSPAVAEVLLKADANRETPNAVGATPLNWLVQMNAPGSFSTIKSKIVDGVKIEVDMTTPQEKAARETLQVLLAGGANPNGVDSQGKTALAVAAQNNHMDYVKLLLTAGADPNQADQHGFSAVGLARDYDRSDMVAFLLENGGTE